MKPQPERIEKGLWWERAWKLVEGCSHVSPGCDHCWSAREANMRANNPNAKIKEQYAGLTEGVRWNGQIRLMEKNLDLPLRAKNPQVWAVWNDLFHEDVSDEFIDLAFGAMALCPQHTFLVLTKRPERMMNYMCAELTHCKFPTFPHEKTIERYTRGQEIGMHLRGCGSDMLWSTKAERERKSDIGCAMQFSGEHWPLPNVYLGVTAENQDLYDQRVQYLRQIPAVVRFISYEPALGPLVMRKKAADEKEIIQAAFMGLLDDYSRPVEKGIDWVICGGESGPGARPMHPDWVRGLRNQCVAAGVPFFFKQWGEWLPQKEWLKQETDPDAERKWVRMDGLRMFRVGKKAAGRLLDGQEWSQWPDVKP